MKVWCGYGSNAGCLKGFFKALVLDGEITVGYVYSTESGASLVETMGQDPVNNIPILFKDCEGTRRLNFPSLWIGFH